MKIVGTGLDKLDLVIEGGFPKGGVIGLSGPPGVGKSVFALTFILEGARKNQKGVFISLDEPIESVNKMIDSFEFSSEIRKFEKKGLIVIRSFDYSEYEKINFDLLEKIYSDFKIERVVIDSFNCFFDFLEKNSPQEISARKLIHSSFHFFRRENLTSLLILEKAPKESMDFSYNTPYLVDGMVCLDFLDFGSIERKIFVPKMRWTAQKKGNIVYTISKKGIITN